MEDALRAFELELLSDAEPKKKTSGPVLSSGPTSTMVPESVVEVETGVTLQQLDYARAARVRQEQLQLLQDNRTQQLAPAETAFFAKPQLAGTGTELQQVPIYKKKVEKKAIRKAAGKTWEDQSLEQWPDSK